ncbi:SPFH domain-containing protein [Edaphobacter aggregans]|uniref:SPFH domain-containing protein n=1 Tax=Edaphobacter aggregans TaxID=570835 RepID=UPI000557826A|nr:SPFH domain-containing protein [Edaphobacter aggregans]
MTLFREFPGNGPTIDLQNPNLSKRLRFGAVLVAVVIACLILFNYVVSITRIGAGYVGVEVVLSGSQRGPAEIPIRTGWVVYSPLHSQIIEFPTFVQTVKWTRDLSEGRATNEEMSFNSKEGMEIYTDVSLSYAIDPTRVPDFYVKYRVNDLSLFTHGILRDVVRNSLNEVASTYSVEQIYGEQKTEFLTRVQALIQKRMEAVGVGIQQFGFIGAPRVPAVIAAAITAKAQAIQDAERARNELAKTQAEAAKTVAEADGEAKAAVTRANGEAEANRIRQSSLTPQLLELRKIENQKALIERWNGQLPTVQSGTGGLLMELPKMQ